MQVYIIYFTDQKASHAHVTTAYQNGQISFNGDGTVQWLALLAENAETALAQAQKNIDLIFAT